ncbi:hypothetical protein BCE75_107197 [Isoptericola sp. CG 20/1183]|uniref:Uncharacterized protein n=1 Tax=Isoptericola halotolerans TaxID=300560 RepID=A0ABX5EFN9_9MICO|nr:MULTISPECIES: hypothetical protein [Isoptericola]PRZ05709.1 hypothetical protein BCL65_107197 [Isoptericola halotolerans]PRZ06277.1 hypothetical protein BCE75_107197 [Isoptericola sp. CG 20/1183]
MTPPADGPGVLTIVTGLLAVASVLFFLFFVLGGSRFFVGDAGAVRPAVLLAVVMAACVGLAMLAQSDESEQRDDAWEQYFEWEDQQDSS